MEQQQNTTDTGVFLNTGFVEKTIIHKIAGNGKISMLVPNTVITCTEMR